MAASASSLPWGGISIFRGAKRVVALSLLTIALAFGPGPEADAQELDDLELTASVGAHFIESMTGQSSAVLGIAADGSTAIRIGAAVMSGDYLHAASITGEAVAGRLIGAVPIIGKVKLLADIGVWFGDRMYQVTGDRNFNAMYARLSAEYPAEQWLETFEAYRRDDFFRAEFQYFARTFADQVLRDAGYRGHILDPEAERIVFEAFVQRAELERAYDEAGLTGRARTPARLREVLEAEIAVAALVAAESARAEADMIRSAEEAERARAEAIALAAAEAEAEILPLPEPDPSEAEMPVVAEPTPEAESADELPGTTIDEAEPDALAAEPEPEEAALPAPDIASLPIAWTITASAQAGRTVFQVSVANLTNEVVDDFVVAVGPVGTYESGGYGWGHPPDRTSLGPNESVEFTAMSLGDVEGLVFSFLVAGETVGAEIALSLHEVVPAAEAPALAAPSDPLPGDWLDLPLAYAGRSTTTTIYRYGAHPELRGGMSCDLELEIDQSGTLTYTHLPCQGLAPGMRAVEGGDGTVHEPYLMRYDIEGSQRHYEIDVHDNRVAADEIAAIFRFTRDPDVLEAIERAGIRFDVTDNNVTEDRIVAAVQLGPIVSGQEPYRWSYEAITIIELERTRR